MQNPSDPAEQLDPDLNTGPIDLQDDLEGDTLREECGVFGIFGHPEAAAVEKNATPGRFRRENG